MRIAPVAEIKARFSAYLKASREGPVIVTRHGKPGAVLLSVEDEEELDAPPSRHMVRREGILVAVVIE